MRRYWIGVASKEHVNRGIAGGFAQVCHGKAYPLKQMREGDGFVYYSPTLRFGEKETCQRFTAIGKIANGKTYPFKMSEDFVPWRIDVNYVSAKDVNIRQLLDRLEFIVDKTKWGFPFRRGCFEASAKDFSLIANAMEAFFEDEF